MQSREQSQEILIEFDENTNANEQAERIIEKGPDVKSTHVTPVVASGRVAAPQLPKAIAALNQPVKTPPKIVYRKRPHLRPIKRPVPVRFEADQPLSRRPLVKLIRTRVHSGVRTVERVQLFFLRMYHHYYFLPARQKRNVFLASLTFLLFLAGLWTGFAVFKINEARRMTEATDGRAIAVRTYKAKPAKALAKHWKKQTAPRGASPRNPASKLRVVRQAAR